MMTEIEFLERQLEEAKWEERYTLQPHLEATVLISAIEQRIQYLKEENLKLPIKKNELNE